VFLVLAIPVACLGLMDLVQAVIGRQLIHPERSTRTPGQLRRDSTVAAVEMLGFAGALVGVQLDSWPLVIGGFIVGVGGFALLLLVRRKPA
jgi:hypothetical protein